MVHFNDSQVRKIPLGDGVFDIPLHVNDSANTSCYVMTYSLTRSDEKSLPAGVDPIKLSDRHIQSVSRAEGWIHDVSVQKYGELLQNVNNSNQLIFGYQKDLVVLANRKSNRNMNLVMQKLANDLAGKIVIFPAMNSISEASHHCVYSMDFTNSTISVYDSMEHMHEETFKDLDGKLLNFADAISKAMGHEKQWSMSQAKSFQQPNTSDCGAFAMANMRALALGQDPANAMWIPHGENYQENMADLRKHLAHELDTLRLDLKKYSV